ncbi:hydrolase [uncultured Winogradskyella sp.]|uniref:hydrolase n=1 Tax=uncultured Winogradskyella sp. TaxID=395353 RepID=UPI0026153EA9|nr:hydrolase [uncultured Winogradskyella sp.]
MNSKNIIDKYEKDIRKYKKTVEDKEKAVATLEAQNFDLSYFNIEHNDNALDYFVAQGYNVDELIKAITEGLYNMNDYKGDDHPIVPFVSLTGSKLLINKVRILNHRWIVANFTDGTYWGEIFVTYSIDDHNDLQYKLAESFIYPKLD